MIRSMCKALTVAAGLAVIASVAMAGVPDPTKSSTDGNYMLGNARGGNVKGPLSTPAVPNIPLAVVDGYDVTVRDVGNVALPGVTVSFNYPGGTLRTHSTQQFGQTASCGPNVISKVTDGAGHVAIVPAVVGQNDANVATQVRANGVLLTSITVRSYDLSCSGTPGKVDGFDFDNFRRHFIAGTVPSYFQLPGCDYTNDGLVNGFDFNGFRTEFLCNTSTGLPTGPICVQTQCGSPCP